MKTGRSTKEITARSREKIDVLDMEEAAAIRRADLVVKVVSAADKARITASRRREVKTWAQSIYLNWHAEVLLNETLEDLREKM